MLAARPLPPDPDIARSGAVHTLVAELRAMIAAEGLVTGDSLPTERELSERFGMARNTVREAIGVLRAYGVIEVRPKVGAVLINRHLSAALDVFSFQLSISPETFADIQGFRQLVEVNLFDALAPHLTMADLARLEAQNAAMLAAPDVAACAAADYAFHHALVAIAGNATLRDVYRIMEPVILRLMETGKETRGRDMAHASHAAIIRALREGDRLAYQYFMADHLHQGLGFFTATTPEAAP
ncbi:MAG: FadR family transcriptional regulator [Rhodobacterales bacterium]|nr:FadR family transcriptional regulator [Rhodobacterales bacterium]NCT13596.1 FadR family transcriptional regulator [Rhodobacterales bacterium]